MDAQPTATLLTARYMSVKPELLKQIRDAVVRNSVLPDVVFALVGGHMLFAVFIPEEEHDADRDNIPLQIGAEEGRALCSVCCPH